MNQSVLGLYYEDFIVGEEIKHSLSKTIFESDNNFFFSVDDESSSSSYECRLCE